MIKLNSHRLNLRPFMEIDLESFSGYRSDPEISKYQSWDSPYTIDQARKFLDEMNQTIPGTPGQWYQLAVERKEHPGIIGDVAHRINLDDPNQAEIGFSFSRSAQNQGYATEAVKCVMGYLFTELNLHRIIAICDVENISSVKLLERVGMRREGHFIENIWFKGSWGSEYLYAILKDEWE